MSNEGRAGLFHGPEREAGPAFLDLPAQGRGFPAHRPVHHAAGEAAAPKKEPKIRLTGLAGGLTRRHVTLRSETAFRPGSRQYGGWRHNFPRIAPPDETFFHRHSGFLNNQPPWRLVVAATTGGGNLPNGGTTSDVEAGFSCEFHPCHRHLGLLRAVSTGPPAPSRHRSHSASKRLCAPNYSRPLQVASRRGTCPGTERVSILGQPEPFYPTTILSLPYHEDLRLPILRGRDPRRPVDDDERLSGSRLLLRGQGTTEALEHEALPQERPAGRPHRPTDHVGGRGQATG